MLRTQLLQLSKTRLQGFNIKLSLQGKRISVMFKLKNLKLESGINGCKNMISLSFYRSGGRFGQGSIGLNRFMENLNVPPFLVDGCDLVVSESHIATNKIQDTLTIIFVFKDLLG